MGDIAVLAPCASRKFIQPELIATAVALPKGEQAAIETAWRQVSARLPPRMPAYDLYGGRGFGLSREAASHASAELYVISAGLGLVRSDRAVPSYGMTVSARGNQAIARRVIGRFDPASWWKAVSCGVYSENLASVVRRHRGLLLVALTTPYAAMIGGELAALPAEARARMRLFGHGIAAVLPKPLTGSVMPYDARLDAAVPGTRTDFAQRALRHFCQHVPLDGSVDASRGAEEGGTLLAGYEAPTAPIRPRRSDEEVVALITGHLHHTAGIGRILRLVRDSDGVACEQARFSRLYRLAAEQRTRV